MKYCTNCGCPLEEDANFCITCGAKVIRRTTAARSLETAILETPGVFTKRAAKDIPPAAAEIRSAVTIPCYMQPPFRLYPYLIVTGVQTCALPI